MAADLKNSSSAIPGRLAAVLLSTAEAPIYEMPADTGGDLVLVLTNTSNEGATGAAARAYVSLLNPLGTVSAANRIRTKSLAPGESIEIAVSMGPGDFLSGKAETASVISAVVHGISFTSNVSTATGIQVDAIGQGGYTSGTGTVSSTNDVGTGANRRAYGLLLATLQSGSSGSTGFAAYDTHTATCAGAAMTRKLAANISNGGNLVGSVAIFEYITPASNTTPTLTANVAKSGIAFNLTWATLSLSGVASTGVTATDGPSTSSALNCSVSSAAGRKVLFLGGFENPPQNFRIGGRQPVVAFNGNPSPAFAVPHWLLAALAAGAATVAAATSDSSFHAGISLELIPA